MPETIPQFGISSAKAAARLTLANCATFRTLSETVDETTAKTRIHINCLPPPSDGKDVYSKEELESLRGCAVVFTGRMGHRSHKIGEPNSWDGGGIVYLEIDEDVPEALLSDPAEASQRFDDLIDNIVVELQELAGTAPDADHQYLDIREINVVSIERCRDEALSSCGDFFRAIVALVWGDDR